MIGKNLSNGKISRKVETTVSSPCFNSYGRALEITTFPVKLQTFAKHVSNSNYLLPNMPAATFSQTLRLV